MHGLVRTLLVLTLATGSAVAADWPQWLGPNRDSVWSETGIIDRFPPNGPPRKWSVPAGLGYSGPAVADGKVFITDYVKADGAVANNPAGRNALSGKERVRCLEATTGRPIWTYEYDCPYRLSYPGGPRCTPTVSEGKVYTLGAMGHLFCLDAATGAVVWRRDFKTDYGAHTPMWGYCAHPLIHKELLICVVGGQGSAVVAFHKDTGKEVWKKLSADDPGYCPPTVTEAGGVSQLLIWLPKKLYGMNPDSGVVYWEHELEPRYGMSIAAPRRAGEYLFAGGVYTSGVMLKLDPAKPAIDVVWQGKRGIGAYPSNSTPVAVDGVFYAVDQSGPLIAFDAATGVRHWEATEPTTGSANRPAPHATAFLVRHGDRFFLFSETGELILARLTPQKYEELGRAKLIRTTGEAFGREVVWSHPAFAERCVFTRNDQEIACFSLAGK